MCLFVLYHVLNNSTGFKADIAKIAVKNKNKPRTVGAELITYDKCNNKQAGRLLSV